MPKGRISTRELLEQCLKTDIVSILNKHFKGVKTEEEAVALIPKITKDKIKATSITLLKIIYELSSQKKIDLQDFPFARIEKKAKEQVGRKSIRSIVEGKHNKTIWELLKPYSEMNAAVEALKLKPYQLNIIITRALEAKEPEAEVYIKWIEKKPRKPFGHKSIRIILEEKHHKTIWELLKPYQSAEMDIALDSLKLKQVQLNNIILKALEKEEPEAEPFRKWVHIPQKRKYVEGEDVPTIVSPNDKADKIAGIAECSNCGHKWTITSNVYVCLGKELNFGLRAKRCPSCQKMGTATLKIKVGEVIVYKRVVLVDNMTSEEFVDQDGELIQNPLLV